MLQHGEKEKSMNKRTRSLLALSGMLLWGCPVLLPMIEAEGGNALPEPRLKSDRSLEETIQQRRSVRSYGEEELAKAQIAQLCWAAQGVTEPRNQLRASPSAGATYPLELYVATAKGLFRYDVAKHELEIQQEEDIRPALRAAALHQMMVEDAPAVFIIAADIRRTERRYGARAKRYVLMEVGHAGQNILLQAVALDLGAVPIGAFDDEEVARIMRLPDTQHPYYIIPVGPP